MRKEFFKEVLIILFAFINKNPCSLTWDEDFDIITITLKSKQWDFIFRISDHHVIILSSHTAYPYAKLDLDIKAVKAHFVTVQNDNLPF
jgi:hypothetical protein